MASIKKHHTEGCANKGTADNDCPCVWRLDYRPQGMRGARQRVEFKTKKQAERHRDETSHRVARGEYVDPRTCPTFAQAAEAWFNSKLGLRPSHVSDLRARLDKHLIPRIGAERLDRIAVKAIKELRDDLQTDGYARRTINTIIRIVGAVFEDAISNGECAINPVKRVKRAANRARELQPAENGGSAEDKVDPESILNPEEVRALLKTTAAGLYRALFTTAALTGARSGELFALRWSDVYMPKDKPACIDIRRTVTWARLKGEEIRPRYYEPKTKAGRRTIPISPELVATLKTWKLQCAPTTDDLVFPAADGRPIRRSNALRYGLWPALKRAGLRRVNMHSLRHSFASALIMGGAPVTEVQALCGHANPAITLKVYSHYFKTGDSGAVTRLSDAILGSAEKWA
jgi:integrase